MTFSDKTNSDGTFDDFILNDLIAEGFSGDELQKEFKVRQKKISLAIKALLSEVDDVVHGKCEFFTHEDVFGS